MTSQNPSVHDGKRSAAQAAHVERVATLDSIVSDGAQDISTLSIWRIIIQHPVIILCCMYSNIGALMYGFDNISLSLCLSMAPFQQTFGVPVDGAYLIPAYWQSLWNALAQVATGIGAWGAGPISDRFGRRISFAVAGLFSVAGVAVLYTASSPGTFLAGKMVNALGLGMALTTGQIYVSEIAPLRIRGVALSAYAFCMNLGFLIAASIAFKRVTIMDDSAYKVLFASEWAWPFILLLCFLIIPESPYYLARKGQLESAAKSLGKLYNKGTPTQPILDGIVELIREETFYDHANNESTYLECFKGTNWRRTRITLYANGLSQMIGATFIANAPYFMITAGLSPTNTAMMVELGIGFALISSAVTFWLMTFVGRRKMILSGVALAALLFLIMGIAGSLPSSSKSLWTTGITLQLVWWTIGPSIGPSISVAGEISEVRLRAKSQSIGFMFNYAYSTVWNVVVPYMFNPGEGNLGGKMGWIFLATCIIALVIVYLEFPETKDRTYKELDECFQERVPARAFKGYTATGVGGGKVVEPQV